MQSHYVPLFDRIRRVVADLPSDVLEDIAKAVEKTQPGNWHALSVSTASLVANPHYRALTAKLIEVWKTQFPEVQPGQVAFALLSAGRYQEVQRKEQSVELVWTGPDAEAIPLRRTDQVLLQLIDNAEKELTIVTFAVYKIPLIGQAIIRAAKRGATVRLVIESPEASEGKIAYDGIAALGPEVAARSSVFIWPHDKRPVTSDGHHGSLHVKCAVADDRELFLSSANLTAYALTLNMEMGVLIRGGVLPGRVTQHFDRLIQTGILTKIG
ncbi:MAG: DISARM system phospholipase D-like protein DrmC [Chloroflexi bacterium]|nr:DISARM system phospholipase D-like protein DrmC [Chloroflexota bacterium]